MSSRVPHQRKTRQNLAYPRLSMRVDATIDIKTSFL